MKSCFSSPYTPAGVAYAVRFNVHTSPLAILLKGTLGREWGIFISDKLPGGTNGVGFWTTL